MSFLAILLFLVKYGPAIFAVVKDIISRIKWLRANRKLSGGFLDTAAIHAFNDDKSIIRNLHVLASRDKATGGPRELLAFRDQLAAEKARMLLSLKDAV